MPEWADIYAINRRLDALEKRLEALGGLEERLKSVENAVRQLDARTSVQSIPEYLPRG